MRKFTLPYTALPALSQFSKRLSDNYINNNVNITLRSTLLSALQDELVQGNNEPTELLTANQYDAKKNTSTK
jgi:hypothetical protein